jgi:hypothetical protein
MYEAWGERLDGRLILIKGSEDLEEVARAVDANLDRVKNVSVFSQQLLFTRRGTIEEKRTEKAEAPR